MNDLMTQTYIIYPKGRAQKPNNMSSGRVRKMAEQEERKKIPLAPENLLEKRKAYQALKATEALLEKKRRGK